MGTSGSFDFTLTRDNLITLAFQRCGALEDGDSPSTAQVTMAATFLESFFKSLHNEGIGSFTFPWTLQSLSASSSVTGDTDSLPYRCIYPHTGAAGNRPTSGAQWPGFWIQDPATAGGSWATSAYTSAGVFSLPTGSVGINLAKLRYLGVDYRLDVYSASLFGNVFNKGAKGQPEAIYVDRDAGVCNIYPQPDQVSPTYLIRYQNVQLLEDFDSGANNADLTTRGLEMLSFGLAYKLSFPLGIPLQERLVLKNEFVELKRYFLGSDKDYRGNERVTPSVMIV